jgi:hypothetical protein
MHWYPSCKPDTSQECSQRYSELINHVKKSCEELRSEQLAFGSVNCQYVSFLSMIMFLCSGQHEKLPESNIKKSALFQFKRPVMTKGCACHMPWWQMTPADSKRRHLWRFLYLE